MIIRVWHEVDKKPPQDNERCTVIVTPQRWYSESPQLPMHKFKATYHRCFKAFKIDETGQSVAATEGLLWASRERVK